MARQYLMDAVNREIKEKDRLRRFPYSNQRSPRGKWGLVVLRTW